MKMFRNVILTILVIATLILIFWAVNPEDSPEWTGFGTYNGVEGETRHKTLWNWLELIIIPVSLGLFIWVFTTFEKDKNKIIEDEKFRDVTLDSFMKVMTELIIQHDLAGDPSAKSIAIAKARISIALDQLDGARKGQILQFLYESDLIDNKPKFKLRGANFNYAILDRIILVEAEVRGAYFENTSLRDSNLNGSSFNSCSFKNADLSNSKIEETDLGYTDLTNAKLRNMDLTTIDFEGANLTNADLQGSEITQNQLDNIFKKEGIKLTKTNII